MKASILSALYEADGYVSGSSFAISSLYPGLQSGKS